MRYIFALIILFSISSLTAGTIDPNKQDISYVRYGQQFDCVGKLCGTYADETMFCASAVAIADNWILTAAHVVKDAKQCFIHINGKKICVIEFIHKKEFDVDTIGEYDIAIGKCTDKIGLKNYPELYSAQDESGKQCAISGYGLHGTFITGAIKSDNNRRAGKNKIDYIFKHTLVCTPSNQISRDYTDMEFLIAPGDSGGGLFIDSKLAGINSFVMTVDKKPNSSYTDEGCHTRISIFKEWIDGIIR